MGILPPRAHATLAILLESEQPSTGFAQQFASFRINFRNVYTAAVLHLKESRLARCLFPVMGHWLPNFIILIPLLSPVVALESRKQTCLAQKDYVSHDTICLVDTDSIN